MKTDLVNEDKDIGSASLDRKTEQRVDWDGLYEHLIADFDETRAAAVKNIKRLRHLVDAVITCKPTSKMITKDQFSVKELVNDLKTVERYIKGQADRDAQAEVVIESAKRPTSALETNGQASQTKEQS